MNSEILNFLGFKNAIIATAEIKDKVRGMKIEAIERTEPIPHIEIIYNGTRLGIFEVKTSDAHHICSDWRTAI